MPIDNSITVTSNSVTVTGYLTSFVATEGDLLIANGLSAEILQQDNSAKLTLKQPWPGPTAIEVTNWRIMKTAPYWHSTLAVAQRIIDLIQRLQAGMPFKVDAFGALTGRVQYNDQDRGFTYLATDVRPMQLFIKQSVTAGDWTAGIQLQGEPGEQGPPGPSTAVSASLSIGTIQTLPPGQNATASVTGTPPNQILNLGIPQGPPGENASGTGGGTAILPTISYTSSRQLVLTDGNKRIRMDMDANGTVTVPTNAAVAFPLDTEIQIFVAGQGDITVVPATGVSIIPNTDLTLTEPGSWLVLRKVGTNAWDSWGDRASGGGTTPPPTTTLTALSLSGSTVAENVPAGTIVGAIIGKTPGSTVSLVNDAGGRFSLNGTSIQTGSTSLDYETATSHNITIRETLSTATNTPKDTTLTITVQDVTEGTGATLALLTMSSTSVAEDVPVGTVVGAINGRTIGSTLSLLNNAGGKFALSGTNVITAALLDYETSAIHTIVVREALAGAQNTPRDTTFTIAVQDINEGGAATLSPLSLSSAVVDEGASAGSIVGTLTGTTTGSTISMSANGGGRFQLVGNAIRTTGSPTVDYEVSSNHIVTITEVLGSSANSPRDTTFRIAVAKVGATPILSALRLQPNTVPEGSPPGTIVGTVMDITSGSTLSLSSDAGGRFVVSGNMIRTGNVTTDYETATSHSISIVETLAGAQGSPRFTTVTVGVLDVVEGGVGNDTTPNDYNIPTVSGADLATVVTSEPVQITGITAATPISVNGMTYSKNGGAYTSTTGTVINNDIVTWRINSSSSYSTSVSGSTTVGGITKTFTVVTRSTTGIPAPGTIQIDEGMWKSTMPYDAAGGTTGTAVEVWPPALLTLDNQYFDRQVNGSIIFEAPVDGARTSGSNYARCELREILPDGSNEYEWTPETGGRLECTCAVLELPTQTVGSAGERAIIGQIHGPNDEPCRLYFYRDGHLEFADDKAGAGTSGTETLFQLKNASGQVSAIPLGDYFTYVIEMDRTGIRTTVLYNNVNYTAFSPLSNFWPGKLCYFKSGSYNAIGKVGTSAGQQGTGRARVQFQRIIRPKHPHVLGSGTGTTVNLGALALTNANVNENTAAGVTVGTIIGRTVGSTLTMINNAGGRFAIAGDAVVTGSVSTDYEAATSHVIQIRETLTGATNTPRDTSITIGVINLPEGTIALNVLTLSPNSIEQGAPQGTLVGTIQGVSPGSTLSLTDSAGGRFALSGMTLVAGSSPSSLTPADYQVTVRETLAGAVGSPKDTVLTVSVTDFVPALPVGFGFLEDGGNYVLDPAGQYVVAPTGTTTPPPSGTTSTVRNTTTATSATNLVSTLTVPITAPVTGNLLLACFCVHANAGTFTIPSGWTQVVVQSTTSVSGILCWRRATGSENSVTSSWGVAGAASGIVLEIPDATGTRRVAYKQTTSAIDDVGVNAISMQPTGTAAAPELAIAFGLVASFYSVSTASWTNGFTAHTVAAGNNLSGGIFPAVKTIATGGNTNTDFSFSGSAVQTMGFMVSFGTTVSGGGTPTDPTIPPFSAPTNFQWPTQVNPVTHDRDKETIWGARPAGSNPTLQDYGEWRVTCTRKSYSFASPDNNEIRIEVRSGDLYSEPDWTDPTTSERSELQCTLLPPVSAQSVMSWESRFEGSTNSATWFVIMQCFARGGSGGSPPLALTFESNDTLKLITRTTVGGNPLENYRYQFVPSRNTWYRFSVEWKYSISGAGYVRFYINDVLAWQGTNLNVGYSGQTSWEPTLGIYRHEASETQIHRFRNMRINW